VHDLKISLITVCHNAEKTVSQTIQSVINQSFKNIEYIIIDGASADNTTQIINLYKQHVNIFLSEPDSGIYDAMNKGIKLASGDIIGMLNADDSFADNDVLTAVAETYHRQKARIIYGDLNFVNPDGKVVRKWKSGQYSSTSFNWGWMPPHPTFYCERALFSEYGAYSLEYGTAGDYELMLRFMHLNKVNAFYLKKVLINMKVGGVSNRSFHNRLKGLFFDFRAMADNRILLPAFTLMLKPLRKINQFFI